MLTGYLTCIRKLRCHVKSCLKRKYIKIASPGKWGARRRTRACTCRPNTSIADDADSAIAHDSALSARERRGAQLYAPYITPHPRNTGCSVATIIIVITSI